MKKAIEYVQDEGLSLREAASKCDVPKTTPHAKLKLSPLQCRKGPATILSKEKEYKIVQWILLSAEKGFLVTKERLWYCCDLDNVQIYITKSKKHNPFKENRPGIHWFQAFMARHPNLAPRISQKLISDRSVTEEELLE